MAVPSAGVLARRGSLLPPEEFASLGEKPIEPIYLAPAFVTITGTTPTRAGAYMTGRSVTGARFRVFWPCRDGYINFILYGGVAGRRTNEQLVAWMRESGAELGVLAEIDWRTWDPTGVTQDLVDAIETPIARFLAGVSKRKFLEEGHRREMLGYPVANVADTAADPQLAERGFWQDVPGPDGRVERLARSEGRQTEKSEPDVEPVAAVQSERHIGCERQNPRAEGHDRQYLTQDRDPPEEE